MGAGVGRDVGSGRISMGRMSSTGKPHDDDGDLLIGAQAHLLAAVVVTRNTKDFIDLQISVENWEN